MVDNEITDLINRSKTSISHFGILGMKWGKKKGRSKPNMPTGSPEHREKLKLKGKKLSEMTNAELKTLNNRMQLEKQYKELTSSQMSAGKKFVVEFMKNQATQALNTLVSKQLAELMKKVI